MGLEPIIAEALLWASAINEKADTTLPRPLCITNGSTA
jgi:hypothetical protein